jgi:acetyl esterase/lipase
MIATPGEASKESRRKPSYWFRAAPTLFTQDSRPDFAILAYPVIYMKGPLAHASSARSLIGEQPSRELVETVSPHKQVRPDTPPTFIWTPRTDTVVPWENTRAYVDALQAAGVAHEVHIFPEGNHGSTLARNENYASAWPALMLTWLNTL